MNFIVNSRELNIKIQNSQICVVCGLGWNAHLQNHWNPTTGGLASLLSWSLNLWNNIVETLCIILNILPCIHRQRLSVAGESQLNAPHTDKLEPREAGKKLQKIHCCHYLLNQAIPLSNVPPTNDLRIITC